MKLMNKKTLIEVVKFLPAFPVLAFLLIILLSPGTQAAETGTVTATVTAQEISVSVTDGTVAYGTMSVGTTANTLAAGLNDTQTATNNGNVSEDLNIKGQDSTNWTLGAAAGSETYKHEFSTTASFPGTALTTSYQTLATGIAAAGNETFDLQMSTPTSTASYTEQSVDVTVQAVAS